MIPNTVPLKFSRYGETKFLHQLSNWIQPNVEFPLTFNHMLNKITPFFKRCERKFNGGDPSDDDNIPLEELSPPSIQFSPASALLNGTNHHKRGGNEIARDPHELKKVLKTKSETPYPMKMTEEVNEFDVSAKDVCDFIINSQTKLTQNGFTNNSSFVISQNNMMSNQRMPSDLVGFDSTQEATNSFIMNPPPQLVRQLFERGNSMQSCDSLGIINKTQKR